MAVACRVTCALVLTSLLGSVLVAPAADGDYVVGWGDPFLVEDYDLHSTFMPRCAMNDNGDIVVTWGQNNGSATNLHGRIYHPGEGWSEAELLEDFMTTTQFPDVAIDGSGNAVIVWEQINESTANEDIWSNRYVKGVGWSEPESVEENGDERDFNPEILMTDQGDIVSVWTRVSVPTRIMCSEYEAGGGWGEPYILDEAGGSIDAFRPAIDADGEGAISVVWIQVEIADYSVWSKRRSHSSDWGTAEKIADDTGYTPFIPPALKVGDGGNAMSVWPHWNDIAMRFEVWACAYEADVGWNTPAVLSATSYADNLNPVVGVDRDGNAVVLFWRDGGWDDGIYMRTYDVDDGWDDLRMVAEAVSGMVTYPRIAMNDDGAALMVYLSDDGSFSQVRSALLNPTGGWYPSEQISENTLGDASDAQIGIDGDGNAFALWAQDDGGKTNTWAARYSAPDEIPPIVTIESPVDGATINSSSVIVSGYTEPDVSLVVNGVMVAVGGDGAFECNILLEEGENVITATATDEAGNPSSASVTVTCEIPEDAIQEELDDLYQELDETKTELNETIADLDEANSELDDVNDQLVEAGENLDAAESRIDSLANQMMALMALVAVLAILSVVMTILYFSLKKALGSSGKKPEEPEVPPPPE